MAERKIPPNVRGIEAVIRIRVIEETSHGSFSIMITPESDTNFAATVSGPRSQSIEYAASVIRAFLEMPPYRGPS